MYQVTGQIITFDYAKMVIDSIFTHMSQKLVICVVDLTSLSFTVSLVELAAGTIISEFLMHSIHLICSSVNLPIIQLCIDILKNLIYFNQVIKLYVSSSFSIHLAAYKISKHHHIVKHNQMVTEKICLKFSQQLAYSYKGMSDVCTLIPILKEPTSKQRRYEHFAATSQLSLW